MITITMINSAPLVKWHNCYDMLMLKEKILIKLRFYAWNAWKLHLDFILFYIFRYIEICHWYIVLHINRCAHCSKKTIDLYMPKAIIFVTIVTNKCIDRHKKTDIGTIKYSIATTFRSTCTCTILYRKFGTAAPYNFRCTLIHVLQWIMGIEWLMISYGSTTLYGLFTELYHSIVHYRSVLWYHQPAVIITLSICNKATLWLSSIRGKKKCKWMLLFCDF